MKTLEQIKHICAKYSGNSICMSIDNWIDCIQKEHSITDVQTSMDKIKLGYFGDVFGCRIFVSKLVKNNYFKIRKGNEAQKHVDTMCWSPDFNLDTNLDVIERYLNLPAFW